VFIQFKHPEPNHLLDLISLTGAVKTFKPTLRQDVIELIVENNPVHGMMAQVKDFGGNFFAVCCL
jgi:hypothetical protein